MICHFCKEKETLMTVKFAEKPFQPLDKNPYPCCKECYDRLNDNPRVKRKGKDFGKKAYEVYVSLIFKPAQEESACS